MFKVKILVLFVTIVVGVSGCSVLLDTSKFIPWQTDAELSGDYKNAIEADAITVPEDLDSASIQQAYPIPEVSVNLAIPVTGKAPRPAPLTAGSQLDAVRLQRLGQNSWAVVNVAPGQLWPQVRAFLLSSGIDVASVDASGGIIDTTFVMLENKSFESRFRFRVDSGVQRNTSELQVLQQNLVKDLDLTSWPQNSDDLELERTMLRNIAQFIANSAESAPVSMMAEQAMTGAGRIVMEESSSGAQLRVDLPFNRAWAATEKGFTDSGFRLDDKNRSAGLFYVTYLGPEGEENGGWFSWLGGSKREDPLVGQEFRVQLTAEDTSQVTIHILGSDGQSIGQLVQQGLLTLLQGNIT
ncbi:MAG: outer membrane protein assembly factor BamC [Pseudomonadota bacterium]|nr:outer membrane protein assembly factor BamC [Pseudomonadota bacterium]